LLSKAVLYIVSSVTLATESVRELRFSFDHCKFLSFFRAALFCTLSGSAPLLVIFIFIIDIKHLYLRCHILQFGFVNALLLEMLHHSFRFLSKHLYSRCRIIHFVSKHLYSRCRIHFIFFDAPLLETSHHSCWSSKHLQLRCAFIMFSSIRHHLRCRIIHFVHWNTITWDVTAFILFIKAPPLEMSNYSFRLSKHLRLRCRIIYFVVIEAPSLEMSHYSSHCIYIYIYIYSEISYSFFKSSQYMSSQVKSSQVKSSQFKSIQVNHFSEAPSSWDVHIHMSLEAPLVGMSVYEYTFLGSTSRDVRVFFFLSFFFWFSSKHPMVWMSICISFLFSLDVVLYEPSPFSSHVCGILSVVNICCFIISVIIKIVSFELTEIQARNRTHYFLHLTVYIYIYIFVLPAIVPLIIVIPVVFPTEIHCLSDRNSSSSRPKFIVFPTEIHCLLIVFPTEIHSYDDFTVVAAAAATAAVNDFGVVVLTERENYHFWCCNYCCYSSMTLIDCTSSNYCCCSRTNLIDCTVIVVVVAVAFHESPQ